MPKKQTIELSVGPTREILEDFARTFEKVKNGEYVNPRIGLNFESFNGLKRVLSILTRKRLELISAVRHQKPESIYKLSKILKRDLKSVNTDIEILKQSHLLELKQIQNGRKRTIPIVLFDKIEIKVKV